MRLVGLTRARWERRETKRKVRSWVWSGGGGENSIFSWRKSLIGAQECVGSKGAGLAQPWDSSEPPHLPARLISLSSLSHPGSSICLAAHPARLCSCWGDKRCREKAGEHPGVSARRSSWPGERRSIQSAFCTGLSRELICTKLHPPASRAAEPPATALQPAQRPAVGPEVTDH